MLQQCNFSTLKQKPKTKIQANISISSMQSYLQSKKQSNSAQTAYSIKIALDIWIFTDCANAITRLKKLEYRTQLMQKMHKNCKMLSEIDHKIYIHWILEHVKISRNLQADEQAKKRLKKSENSNNVISFQYLNKRIKNDKFKKWNSMWQDNTKKGKYYKLHNLNLQ